MGDLWNGAIALVEWSCLLVSKWSLCHHLRRQCAVALLDGCLQSLTCGKSAWPVTWGCLIYKTGRKRDVRRGCKEKVKYRNRWEVEEAVRCNYVSPQWQAWITNFNSKAMKVIWSGLNCKETAAGNVMKICWDDMLCLRIHQTCLVRWKATVIHSVG